MLIGAFFASTFLINAFTNNKSSRRSLHSTTSGDVTIITRQTGFQFFESLDQIIELFQQAGFVVEGVSLSKDDTVAKTQLDTDVTLSKYSSENNTLFSQVNTRVIGRGCVIIKVVKAIN